MTTYCIWWVIIFFVSYEAVMWGWTLNRHAVWLKLHPQMEKRVSVSYRMLRVSSAMSAMLSVFIWFLFMYVSIKKLQYQTDVAFWIFIRNSCIIALQLSHIHFSAIIARYSCLPRSMWPLLSKIVSMALVKFFHMKEPILTSFDVHTCWHIAEHQCDKCDLKIEENLKEEQKNGKKNG